MESLCSRKPVDSDVSKARIKEARRPVRSGSMLERSISKRGPRDRSHRVRHGPVISVSEIQHGDWAGNRPEPLESTLIGPSWPAAQRGEIGRAGRRLWQAARIAYLLGILPPWTVKGFLRLEPSLMQPTGRHVLKFGTKVIDAMVIRAPGGYLRLTKR